MQYKRIDVDKPKLKIIVAGDVHLGSLNADIKAFEKMLANVKREKAKLLLMGDLVDAIAPGDKRFDWKNVNRDMGAVGEQFTYLEQKLEPVADNIIGLICGNHYSHWENTGFPGTKAAMCKRLGTTFLMYRGLIDIRTPERRLKISAWHGAGGGYEMGGIANRLTKETRKLNADVYCMGHSHRLFHFPKGYLDYDDNGKMLFKMSFFCNTGAFLRTYDENTSGYGEAKGYDPEPIGYTTITLDGTDIEIGEVFL